MLTLKSQPYYNVMPHTHLLRDKLLEVALFLVKILLFKIFLSGQVVVFVVRWDTFCI